MMIARVQKAAIHYLANPVASNAAKMGAMRFLNVALGFITTVLIIRGIGAHAFGLFAFAVGVAAMGSVVMRSGVPLLIVRIAPAALAKKDWRILSAINRFSAVAGFVTICIVAFAMVAPFAVIESFIKSDFFLPYLAGVAGAALITLSAILQAHLHAMMKISQAFGTEFVIAQGSRLLLILALMTIERLTLNTALMAFLTSWLIGAASGLYWWRKYKPHIALTEKSHIPWLKWSKMAASLFILGTIMFAVGKIEVLFLATAADPSAIGEFAFAFRIASVTSIAGFAVSSMFSPALSKFRALSRDAELNTQARLSLIVNVFASTIIALSVSMLSIIAIPHITPELADACYLVPIIASGFVLASFAGRPVDIVAMLGSMKSTWIPATITIPFFLFTLWLLTQIYGAYGAAIATALTISIYSWLLAFIAFRETGVRGDILSISAHLSEAGYGDRNVL